MPRILALALLAVAIVAAPAPAATVRMAQVFVPDDDDDTFDREDDSYTYGTLRFQASPGERNRLVVRPASRGRILFRDPGARIRPGRGCRAAGVHAVLCGRGTALRTIRVVLGGGADRLTVSARLRFLVNASGGPGADRLTTGGGRAILAGGSGDDRLVGGGRSDALAGDAGRDRLEGRGGDDRLDGGSGADRQSGGPGDDTLHAAGSRATADDDRLDGGAGSDTASYARRTVPVVASPAGGGMAGEADVFTSVESLAGGAGDDVLTGDDGRNTITAGDGHDRVDGRGGDDLIVSPFLVTDPDSLDATCGDGSDVVREYYGDVRVLARPDCERVRFTYAGPDIDPRPSPLTGRVFRLFMPCASPQEAENRRVLVARTPGAARRWYETGPFGVEVATGVRPRGASTNVTCPVDFELSDAGLELLTARSELPLEVPTNLYGAIAVLLRNV